MNSSARIWDDTVLPFQLDKSDIRGRVARLDGVLDGVLKQHNYPSVVKHWWQNGTFNRNNWRKY